MLKSDTPSEGSVSEDVENGHLSERKKLILHAIVDAYIAGGEPIGSKILAAREDLSCSSATIRNEMAELESMGYLVQPHTSAGRIPSERGYRFYVDSLLTRYRLTTRDIERLNLALQRKLTVLDGIFEEASRLAASVTGYAAITTKPRAGSRTIMRFESVYIDDFNLVLVMIFDADCVKNRTIRLSSPVTKEELRRLTGIFNRLLTGKTSDQLGLSLAYEIERMMGRAAAVVEPLVKVVFEAVKEADTYELSVEGVDRLLEYPEFSDMRSFRDMLGVFEEKTPLLDVIGESSDDGIQVYIGGDAEGVMKRSTLIFKKIKSGGRVVGTIGIIGPRRMDYSRVIATLELLSTGVSKMLSGAPPPNWLESPDPQRNAKET